MYSNENRPDRAVCKLWLAFIDELRTKNAEVVLSLTEELKLVYEEIISTYESTQEEQESPTK